MLFISILSDIRQNLYFFNRFKNTAFYKILASKPKISTPNNKTSFAPFIYKLKTITL